MGNRSVTCPPLGDGTNRVNIQRTQRGSHPLRSSPIQQHGSLKPDSYLVPKPLALRSNAAQNQMANPRLSAIAQDSDNNKGRRNSQISTTSTNSNSNGSKVKQCIGPWRLGKTLGRGATARVRLARNIYTGQEAAVKIVQKNSAQLSQAGSLAALDRAEARLPIEVDGLRRMPIGIEREIAIMKLIQHPNIISLYDIWENHSEIYLVLEYVDNGELFSHITSKGRLGEEEAMKYFRQVLSAVGYCHSFNICHRDLKPENILLTKSGEIKIADFGMAALHQSPDHKLETSCGSPHYAAPELIKGASYKGNMVDIWSMGVVLFATLAGRLPFDVEGGAKEWLGPLLSKIRKGQYDMSEHFSYDASCLIWEMLQVNPEKRIRLSQIWAHPVVRKYDYLDNLGGGKYPQSPSAKDYARPIVKRSDIQKDLVRYLRSMWHKLSEQEIIDALMSNEANDQKLFYSLLSKYQDSVLENYQGDLAYSTSDYHHVRPACMTKTYSTCHFPQSNSKGTGHGRQMSKFTVISNVPETERSYDPFKASRPQHLNGHNDGVRITIHRAGTNRSAGLNGNLRQNSRASSAASSGSAFGKRSALAPPNKMYASRSSIASSTRSRNSTVRATVGHGKRGVSFTHLRRDSVSDLRKCARVATNGRHSNFTEVTDDDGDVLRPELESPGSTLYIRSKKPPISMNKSNRTSSIWNDDVRHLSSSLAKDCDEAFNRTSAISSVENRSQNGHSKKSSTSLEQKRIKKQEASNAAKAKQAELDSRPLPPAPERTASVRAELLEARKQAEYRKMYGNDDSPGYLNRLVTHIDRLIQPISPSRAIADRRTASAPVTETRQSSLGAARQLHSIYEMGSENSSPQREQEFPSLPEHHHRSEGKHGRIASAPEASSIWETMHTLVDNRSERGYRLAKETIRVVPPSSPMNSMSPVRPPAPLNIRKKSSQLSVMSSGAQPDVDIQKTKHQRSVGNVRQQYSAGSDTVITPDLERIDENVDPFCNDSFNSGSGTIRRKKSLSWFKRSSKGSSDGDLGMTVVGSETSSRKASQEAIKPSFERTRNPYMAAPTPAPILADQPKKKVSFNLPKWLSKKRDSQPDMEVADVDIFEDDSSVQESMMQQKSGSRGHADYEDGRNRVIAPQRNWLAKIFNVKPACRFICFTLSKRRARQEIVAILKEWRRYGIQELQIDKERNVIFGKVGEKNFFNMKGVSFAGEVMTVIEHGKRSQLSIARFTQEQGAASSFIKVIESMEVVFRGKKVLVADKRKEKMMIKTLSSAS